MITSSVVAVAGGTGGLGRAIIDAILADGKQQVFAMTRRTDKNTETELGEAELKLVAAADQAITSKRYIASNWGAKFPAE
ncbi:Nmra-like family [Fusarium agapanthi]|uniref:Nmra-like family n=1 Tax=Fusarium agapanthi TaxID=1803897 RepID=A0A9P5AZH2_9HYPO|nr:Nmra-like family [Fusarium agapanthi]